MASARLLGPARLSLLSSGIAADSGPDSDAPILWQVAVCRESLTDQIMTRFAAVKRERTVALAKDMNAAAQGKLASLPWSSRFYARTARPSPNGRRRGVINVRAPRLTLLLPIRFAPNRRHTH
jgi:hypothetical protein